MRRRIKNPEIRIKSRVERYKRRSVARIERGKGELPVPLTFNAANLREQIKSGYLEFVHEGKKIRVQIRASFSPRVHEYFQGIYSLPNGELFVMRSEPEFLGEPPELNIYNVKNGNEQQIGFCWIANDRSMHLRVGDGFKRHSFALKLFSKVLQDHLSRISKEPAAPKKERVSLNFSKRTRDFIPTVKRFGFKVRETFGAGGRHQAEKKERLLKNPKQELSEYVSFEAFDAKTGRKRWFRFKVQG